MSRIRLAAACVAALATIAPAAALGDSDPASDFLPTQNVFLPYSPRVSPALVKDLQRFWHADLILPGVSP